MKRLATSPLILSVACGLLMAVSFPLGPPLPGPRCDGWWPAAWICLAPLMLAAAAARRVRTAAACGLVAGAAAFALILAWLLPFLRRWAGLSAPEAAAVFLLLIMYVALYPAAFAACVRFWSGRWGAPAAFLLAPPAWCALELARGALLTGFPWCLLGYSQQPALAAIQVADLAGVYGISFLLAASGAAAALLLAPHLAPGAATPGGLPARTALMMLAAIAAAGPAYGAWRLGRLEIPEARLPVALIQANVAQSEKWDAGERERIEAEHVEMTREAARRGASFIIWSESSVPIAITHHPEYAARLEALAGEMGVEILVGTVAYESRDGNQAPFNSAVLVRPGAGLSGRYDKLRLVPFGEYVPLKDALFFLEPLVHEASDFVPGEEIQVLGGAVPPFGTLICYEAIFPDLTRRYVKAGASFLVNITNDAWYDATAMPRQHLAQAALRAVESRRYLLRCANTGISAVVEPSGRIARSAPLNEKAILEARIGAASGPTPYASAGDAFAICCVILTVSFLAAAFRAAPRRGHHAR